ncbi:unnamed protein product [Prunus armeniaca]
MLVRFMRIRLLPLKLVRNPSACLILKPFSYRLNAVFKLRLLQLSLPVRQPWLLPVVVGGRGGRGGHGFGDRSGFAGRASDRCNFLSAPRFGSSPNFGSYSFSQSSSSQPRRHHNSGQGVLGPPPSSFGSNSSSRGPLQCYNCRGFGHVDVVCPSKSTSVPTPPTRLQGMTAHHLSHGGAQQWVADIGANTHITNDLSHLSLAREYHGSNNVGGVLGGTGFGDGEDSFPRQE